MKKLIVVCTIVFFVSILQVSGAGKKTKSTQYYLVKDGKACSRIYLPRVFGKATMLAAS